MAGETKYLNEFKKTRQRKNTQHRWTKQQSEGLLEAIIDKLKDEPEKFEKPTASQFYTALFNTYALYDLAKLGVIPVKNKIRNMKQAFMRAKEWKRQTGNGLVEEGKEDNVKEYIDKICPHYNLLENIFGERFVNLPVVIETTDEVAIETLFDSNTEKTFLIDDSSATFLIDDSSADFAPSAGGAHSAEEATTESSKQGATNNKTEVPSKESIEKFKNMMKRVENNKNKRPVNSSLHYLTIIQEKRNELEKNKFEYQMKIEEEKLIVEKERFNMEKKRIEIQNEIDEKRIRVELDLGRDRLEVEKEKLQLEREKHKADYDLRKLEMEKQYELKKLELELKYKYKDN